jgi:hypothetical protein
MIWGVTDEKKTNNNNNNNNNNKVKWKKGSIFPLIINLCTGWR